MHPYLTIAHITRFWAKVAIASAEDCWSCAGIPERGGYIRVRLNNRRYLVHRLAYELTYGAIGPNLQVCHSCDNPPCCNPHHLWLGTTQQNTADRVAKERSASGDRNGSRVHPERLKRGDESPARVYRERRPRGENHPARLRSGDYFMRGDRHWTHQRPERLKRGSENAKARLSEPDIPLIRRRLAAGESGTAIARDYGVAHCAIYAIKHGKAWRHVP